MSDGRQHSVLRMQHGTIAALRSEFASALSDLNSALLKLRHDGNVAQPWLGDEISSQVVSHYTETALTGPNSSYRALVTYRDELVRIHDTLQQMEEAYRRGEGDEAARWGPRT